VGRKTEGKERRRRGAEGKTPLAHTRRIERRGMTIRSNAHTKM